MPLVDRGGVMPSASQRRVPTSSRSTSAPSCNQSVTRCRRPDDLEQTVKEVEALGRRIVAKEVDVRDYQDLKDALKEGTAELGPVQIVLANAGIGPGGMASNEQQWEEVIGVNLTGVWNTGRAAIPSMIKAGKGGAIVLTSSTGGLTGAPIDTAA